VVEEIDAIFADRGMLCCDSISDTSETAAPLSL